VYSNHVIDPCLDAKYIHFPWQKIGRNTCQIKRIVSLSETQFVLATKAWLGSEQGLL